MSEDVNAIVSGLAETENVAALCSLADQRVEAGDAAFVADLGIALWRRYGDEPGAPWQYRSAFDHVVRLLTLSPGTVGEAVLMLSVTANHRQCRYAAALLASAHAGVGLADALGAAAPQELRACLLHELVLRRLPVEADWTDEPWWREHPLAWLPAALTPLEQWPEVPRYGFNGSGVGLPSQVSVAVGGGGAVPPALETTSQADAAAIQAAVLNWTVKSNGRSQARTYELGARLRPDAVAGTLRGLGLESLQGLDGVGSGTPENAWEQLFGAARSGGAYSSGELGAYGRLAAWQSVAALAGARTGAPISEVEAAVQACAWYSFAGASDWFQRVAWDIGLAAVSPDGRRLAVLTATDTD
ncbi:DUF6183 family protein [Dactylosporangium sp. NPDC051484]|uniref:DUF6183 family protein n=1 Tax=Dactylosporangium sp. NPDC051484 TaxID=3154942 RepID=UPI00344C704C